jgi:S-methylmethionine-dependent homocysteine/selenocysteine methylase
MISAYTINYVEEAMGIALVCKSINIPLIISFTVNVDGKLPSGMTLEDSIKYIDKNTDYYPMYYMINCAHPKHFISLFTNNNSDWIKRIKGIRPNASDKRNDELNNSTELDIGNIDELSDYCKNIKKENKYINIIGGCCGTDENHIEKILTKCLN